MLIMLLNACETVKHRALKKSGIGQLKSKVNTDTTIDNGIKEINPFFIIVKIEFWKINSILFFLIIVCLNRFNTFL